MLYDFTQYIVGLTLILTLGFVALKAKAIDKGGLIAGILVASIIFLGGGFGWLLTIIAFFISAAVLTKHRYEYKRMLGFAQDNSGKRGWPNIIANGSIPAALALLEFIAIAGGGHGVVFSAVFVGSVAAATADTLATEVGLLSKAKPRNIIHLRHAVDHGTSGGVTILGELTIVVSSLMVGLLASLVGVIEGATSIVISISLIGGISGATLDSILGATIQGVNKCAVCGTVTESHTHHDKEAKRIRGVRFIDNNMVNFLGIGFGAALSFIAFFSL